MLDRSLALAHPTKHRHGKARWLPDDVRLRLIAALALGFACATIESLLLVPVMLALALALARLAGTSWRNLASSLRLPGLVVLALVALLPFAGGATALGELGPLTLYREGLEAAVLIGGRALAIVILAFALLGRLETGRLLAGLRALGVPAMLVDIAMLMQRYIVEIGRDLAAMRLAMRLRGQPWRLRLATLQGLGWVLAALLLRSHERAERIWTAMRLRGHGTVAPEPLPPPDRADRSSLAALAMLALALVLAGRLV